MINKKYLSETAKKVNPYQWEKVPLGKFLRFDANTLPYPPPSLGEFLSQMAKNCPVNEYSDPSYRKLKELIADYEGVRSEMITVTNSGDEAIDVLGKTFLNPGDNFITTPPTYEMFSIQSVINKGKELEVPLNRNNFEIDKNRIIETCRKSKVKIIFLVNPNNPTASVISIKDIEEILKKSKAIVVVDEVYREFYGKTSLSLINNYENLVILRSFSKFAAMAGARIGYLISSKYLAERFDTLRFPMGVSYLSYKLAETVLEKDRIWIKKQIEMIKRERSFLRSALSAIGLKVYPSYANFMLVKVGKNASKLYKRLKLKGLIIRDRSSKKYLDGCVRITVRSPEENRKLIRTIKGAIYEI